MSKVKAFAAKVINKVKSFFSAKETEIAAKAHEVLDGTVAEAYVDTGVKILIAVVIGALLLAGLYALFNSTIMPTVTTKIQGLFTSSDFLSNHSSLFRLSFLSLSHLLCHCNTVNPILTFIALSIFLNIASSVISPI